MAKLIRSHIECGHRAHEKCFHSDRKHIVDCKPKGECIFPFTCPLEEGIALYKIKHLLNKSNNENNNKL